MLPIQSDPAMWYALERWRDLRSIAADREVIAVWYDQPYGTWIAFQRDAIRAAQHWDGRDQIPEIAGEDTAYFVMSGDTCANVAAHLRADNLRLCRTFRNLPGFEPGTGVAVIAFPDY